MQAPLLGALATVPSSLMLTIPIFFACSLPSLLASSTFNEGEQNHLEAVPGERAGAIKWAVLLFEGLVLSPRRIRGQGHKDFIW